MWKPLPLDIMQKTDRDLLSLTSLLFRFQKHLRSRSFVFLLLASLATAVSVTVVKAPAQAQGSAAPVAVVNLIKEVDAAANSQKAETIIEFLSPNFTHSDGLNRQSLQESLTSLWKRYPNLKYHTELKSWKRQGKAIVAETVTHITGTKQEGDREYKLTSHITSRQQIEDQKIVRQDVLDERSQITSGSNPPTVKVIVPAQVRGGQEFNFDAIVQEPLEDDLLLGAALEEPIKPEGFLKVTTANLEPLNSGGLFKVGRAPRNTEQHWLSAVVVRHDGITIVTQRLKIQGR